MCVRSTEILLRRVAAPVIANMSKETEFEKNSILENWTHCGKKKKKKPQGHGWPECALPPCYVCQGLWVSCDLGKGRRNGDRNWMGEREENGERELVSGISLIVSIPPHEYLELYFLKLFGRPNTAFRCFRVSQK